ncbi:hypothetical protein EJ110_NYTH37464 [Nymphaea thermarum]|nr:hypothetical protein EJ110_NYTH37464 [Nymphaea thermarum]
MVGGGGGSSASSRSLEQTPTWAVAVICVLFIAVSFLLEHLLSSLGNWLRKKRKKALSEALEKIKSELMLLGFLSLLLTVGQRPLSSICVPAGVADKMLPCKKTNAMGNYRNSLLTGNRSSYGHDNGAPNYAPYDEQKSGNSVQASDPCSKKIRRWKHWEKETQTTHYQVSNDPQRFRFLRETTFGRRHMSSWSRATVLLWIKCFFRQFYSSVEKVDYLTLRHAFISTHLPTNSYFNFHEYIKRSLDNDFKAIVGISPILWLLLALFLLLNVHGLYLYFWLSFVPLVLLVEFEMGNADSVGSRSKAAGDSGTDGSAAAGREKCDNGDAIGSAYQRALLVRPSPARPLSHSLDTFPGQYALQWLISVLITIRMSIRNAFELTFFIWITYLFGLKSCYHEKFEIIVVRVVLAFVVQFVCSYVTLPLYALVTQVGMIHEELEFPLSSRFFPQMGSHFKESIFNEQTMNALRRWHRDVREKKKQTHGTADSSPPPGYNVVTIPPHQMASNSTPTLQSTPALRSPTGGKTKITIAEDAPAQAKHQQ